MNKLRGEHEIKLDADEIALIFQNNKLGNLAELIAQQQETLENILTKHKGIQFQHEDGFDVDKALEDLVPETKLGDIWQLGQHRIICADCSDERSINRLIEDKEVNILLTDPPYGMDLDTDFSKIEGSEKSIGKQHNIQGNKYDKIIGDAESFDAKPILDIFKMVKEQFWFGADYYVDTLPNYGKDGSWVVWDKRSDDAKAEAIGSSFELCWSKQKHKRLVLRHEWFGFLSSESPTEARNRMHPTQKPIILFSDILQRWSNDGDIIIDPFLGSGSTLIACEQTNRICYGVEIDPHYVDVCVKRYEAYTNNKATKVQEVI
jgi:DNA modification methylase